MSLDLPTGKGTLVGKIGIAPLAQGFINDDGNGIGKIQAADEAQHGNADATIVVFLQKRLGKTVAFFPENKINILVRREGYVAVAGLSFRGAIVKFAVVLCSKILPVGVGGHGQIFPIIQSCTADASLAQFKAERLDEV